MQLGVNVDHVATVRQARRIVSYPSPVQAAVLAQKAGADAIVMHLREDRRHIQDADLYEARNVLQIALNMEMSVNKGIVDVACDLKPEKATIVPERRQELTTEGGFDLFGQEKRFLRAFRRLTDEGVEVSVFIDPVKKQISRAAELGVETVELHTGAYADASTPSARRRQLDILARAAAHARKLGLFVAAGHGLNYENTSGVAAIAEIEELNIGHSIISEAVYVGITEAVREMKQVMFKARRR